MQLPGSDQSNTLGCCVGVSRDRSTTGHRPAAVCYTNCGAGLSPFMFCYENKERNISVGRKVQGRGVRGCAWLPVCAAARHWQAARIMFPSALLRSYMARSSTCASRASQAFLALPEYTANKRQWSGGNLNKQLKIKVFHMMLTHHLPCCAC